jgi:hypothetical protein
MWDWITPAWEAYCEEGLQQYEQERRLTSEELLVALDVVQDEAPVETQLWAVALLEAVGVLPRLVTTALQIDEIYRNSSVVSMAWAWLGDSCMSYSSSANFLEVGSASTSHGGRRMASNQVKI